MQLWGLATLKSIEKASMLEIQVRAGAAGLSAKSVGQANRISTQVRFLCYCLEVEFPLFQETSVFFLKTFNWLDEAHSNYGG